MEHEEDLVFIEEKKHLEDIKIIIQSQLDEVNANLDRNKEDILSQKRYLWENIYELDPEEIVSNEITISEGIDSYQFTDERKRLLEKLLGNPYFGRIDFVYEGEDEPEILYIGLGGLRSKNEVEPLIYDWRAPISSMYYDFDIGKAYYQAPIGQINGEITQKRQLKIKNGEIEYALNSDIKIDDEILQKELSGNGSTKMRNIVATIQKEQNRIVRDQSSNIMIVQGVAGSGKTSIALHRIAFLLYQNRSNLKSSEILIISPNSIFADYISNVLPELGEQNITEVSFDEIAKHEIGKICKYESKYEQMEYVINCKDDNDSRLKQIRFKNSMVFLDEIKMFVQNMESSLVEFKPYTFKGYTMSESEMHSLYNGIFSKHPLFERLDNIGDRIADLYESNTNGIVSVSARNEIKQGLYAFARSTNPKTLYAEFIDTIREKYPVLKDDYIVEGTVLYEDVFPILLLKFMLFGKKRSQFDRIKHVIVDEMQDYSMAQYELLKLLFGCKMTILGDINQVIDRNNDVFLNDIQTIFGEKATLVRMLKSYRSTYEISEFCRKLCDLNEAESFERHGEAPSFEGYNDYEEMIKAIQIKMDQADMNVTTTVVVICKTSGAADKLYHSLDLNHQKMCYLLNDEGSLFNEGIIITNSYLVKGLEFDHVIVPEVNKDEYVTERDRQILYIAGTRALHKLDILYYGEKSGFLY